MEQLIENSLKLGFGLMRLPRMASGEIDVEQTKQMVDLFMEAGGRYFDTAFVYQGSEEATRQALCERYPRDSYYLATKLNAGEFCCKSEQQAREEIRISLERTGAEYFDFYLLHALDSGNMARYEKYGLWEYLKELKEQGIIRHFGFSFHDKPEVLDQILTAHPEAEFVQLQINYADWENPGVQSRACYEVAEKHGKPVVVMEPVKGGLLAASPETVESILKTADPDASCASWAVRFAASQPNVFVVLSGMSTTGQMENNLSYMKEFRPLSGEEYEVIAEARKALDQIDKIPCTACAYCKPGCPMSIDIPAVFSVANVYKMYDNLAAAKNEYFYNVPGAKASECVGCGQCESACPQHLPIISLLQEAAEKLEQ